MDCSSTFHLAVPRRWCPHSLKVWPEEVWLRAALTAFMGLESEELLLFILN
jgi:hypothetical protein